MNALGRILLVEDQREWQKKLQDLLPEGKYSVKTAETFQKAKDLLKDHVFDLVLLDLRLTDWKEGSFEGMDLLDTVASIRKEQGTQAIIISAYGQPQHVREGFKKYDIVDYIDKKKLTQEEYQKSVADAVEKAYEERGESLSRKY